jgi:RNA polymerase-binding transcription factor DksA
MATSKKKSSAGNKNSKADKARKHMENKSKSKAIEKHVKAKVKNVKPSKSAPAPAPKAKPAKETAESKRPKASKPAPLPPAAKARETKPEKEQKKPVEETKAKIVKNEKAPSKGKEEISPAALQAIAAVKASSGAKAKAAPKKAVVSVFTLDDVRDILKNRREEARELAEKKEAAAKKAAVSTVVTAEPTQSRVLGAATLADILGFGGMRQPEKVEETEVPHKREVPAKFRKYFDMLTSLREKIQSKINKRSQAAGKIADEEPELAVPAQTEDDDTFDHDFALSLVANEQDALAEVDAAIERIYDGSYGICEITGKEISRERLNAVPFARYSVEGQAQFEMQNRRRAQRMTTFMDNGEEGGALAGEEADE